QRQLLRLWLYDQTALTFSRHAGRMNEDEYDGRCERRHLSRAFAGAPFRHLGHEAGALDPMAAAPQRTPVTERAKLSQSANPITVRNGRSHGQQAASVGRSWAVGGESRNVLEATSTTEPSRVLRKVMIKPAGSAIYTPDPQLRTPGRLVREMIRDLSASRELAWRLCARNI